MQLDEKSTNIPRTKDLHRTQQEYAPHRIVARPIQILRIAEAACSKRTLDCIVHATKVYNVAV